MPERRTAHATSRIAAGLLAGLLIGSAISAQLPAFRIRTPKAPPTMPLAYGPTWFTHIADMDGDRDLDIIVSGAFDNAAWQHRVWINEGRGHFEYGTDLGYGTRVHIADIDGNGTHDVLNTGRFGTGISLNTHKFIQTRVGPQLKLDTVPKSRFQPTGKSYDIVAGDLNGDGRTDVFTTEPSVANRIYIQNQAGTWVDETVRRLPLLSGYRRAILADVDDDKDLDILLFDKGTSATQLRIWTNDGSGKFRDSTSALLPAVSLETRELRVADLDGDKDSDLVLANKGALVLYLQENGKFVDRTRQRITRPTTNGAGLAVVDLDNDGDQDLIVAGRSGSAAFLNDGKAKFTDVTQQLRVPSGRHDSVAAGDLDGNGLPDLLFARNGPPQGRNVTFEAWRNVFPGHLRQIPVRPYSSPSWLHATQRIADVDGDGRADLIARDLRGGHIQLVSIVGDGTLGTPRNLVSVPRAGLGYDFDRLHFDVVDVDGDRDFDIINGSLALLNDGSLGFTARVNLPRIGTDEPISAFADFDADGDHDAFYGGAGTCTGTCTPGSMEYIRNDGTGGWTNVTRNTVPSERSFARDLAVGDFDGDRDLDVVVVNDAARPGSTPTRMLLNDGKGKFRFAVPFPTVFASGVATGDLDLDGDLDLVFAGKPVRVLLGNGRGTFTDVSRTHTPRGVDAIGRCRLADVDEDGTLDAVFLTQQKNGRALFALINDGRGRLLRRTANSAEASIGLEFDLVDLDGDSDLDVLPLPTTPTRWTWRPKGFESLTRVTTLGDPIRRRTWSVDVLAHHARPTDAALIVLGTKRLTSPVRVPDLGLLWLDPALTVLSPPQTIRSGVAQLRIPIPASFPGGLDLETQSLHIFGSLSGIRMRLGTVESTFVR